MSDKKRDKLQRIKHLLMSCAGWDGDEVARDREKALNMYFMRPRGDEVVGRSNVRDGSLSSMVEANLAQMLESFTNDSIAEYPANGEDDDDQATLETATVVQMVMRDNNGYQEIGTGVKDGLLVRNGICKVYVESSSESEVIDLENATPSAIAALQEQPGIESVDVLSWEPNEDKVGPATIRVTQTIKDFKTEAIPLENFLYLKDWQKPSLQRIPFCAERHLEARGELLRRGFPRKKVMALKAYTSDFKLDSQARNLRQYTNQKHAIDKLAEQVEWYECYVLVDAGKGSVERRRISVAGQSLQSELEDVPYSHVPYAAGSPFINPHRFTGISLYDKLRQNVDINTGLTRAAMDNTNAAIRNGRAYLDGAVNEQDLSDGRPNKDIRVRRSVGRVQDAIMSFDQPDLSSGLLKLLEFQRQTRTELGGASLELATGQMQMAGGRVGSEGVDRAFSVMEQLASHMTKNMATSLIREIFLLAHLVIRENFDAPINVYSSGRWQSVIPAEWQPRRRVTIKVGMSPGERARKQAALDKLVSRQFQLAERDLDDVLVNIDKFHQALVDSARADGLEIPEQYYLDPLAPDQQKALEQKTAAERQAGMEQKALMGAAVSMEQMRIGLEKYIADMQQTVEVWKETIRAEIEEAKIVGKATADLIAQTRFGSSQPPAGETNGAARPEPNDSANTESE